MRPPLLFSFGRMYQITTTTTQTYADALSLADVKAWLKVETTADDDLIGSLRDAALLHCEDQTNRSFLSRAAAIAAPSWQAIRRLPVGPIEGTVALVYYAENESTTTVLPSTEYTAKTLGDVLYISYRTAPPVVDPYRYDAVNLTSSKFGTAAATLPDAVRTAALLLIGHWYENRQAVHIGTRIYETPMAVRSLLAPYTLA